MADEPASRLEHLFNLGFKVDKVHERPSGRHVIVLRRPDSASVGMRLIRTDDIPTISRALSLLPANTKFLVALDEMSR